MVRCTLEGCNQGIDHRPAQRVAARMLALWAVDARVDAAAGPNRKFLQLFGTASYAKNTKSKVLKYLRSSYIRTNLVPLPISATAGDLIGKNEIDGFEIDI